MPRVDLGHHDMLGVMIANNGLTQLLEIICPRVRRQPIFEIVGQPIDFLVGFRRLGQPRIMRRRLYFDQPRRNVAFIVLRQRKIDQHKSGMNRGIV